MYRVTLGSRQVRAPTSPQPHQWLPRPAARTAGPQTCPNLACKPSNIRSLSGSSHYSC